MQLVGRGYCLKYQIVPGSNCGIFISNQEYPFMKYLLLALFACLAKIAKADGRVDESEINKIEEIISKKLNLNKEHRKFAINIFQKAKDDNISFESYASNLYQILSSSPNSLLVFYEILFELALADGILHPKEEELLK